MKTDMNMGKREILDKLGDQIETADAKLNTAKAWAKTEKANAEINAITEMLTVLVLFGAHEKEAESPKRVSRLCSGVRNETSLALDAVVGAQYEFR